ncbi:MAG: restriction endonuclease subunit S [Xanthomonadales bacterium]|nr:restriction endonuclease subunit S [Xanthomonadales bacterium]
MTTLEHYAELNPTAGEVDRESLQQVAFVPMAAVSEGGRLEVHETRPISEVAKGYTNFARGDVIVAKITPCMENGKAAHLSNLATEVGFGSTEFHVLRPKPGVDGRFLFYLVWNQRFRAEAAKHMTGSAGQKRVPASYLRRATVPLVSPREQSRIADILDKADAIRRKRKQAIALTEELLRSAFLDMFGDPVANPRGWQVREFGDVIEDLDAGWSANGEARQREDDEYGVLKVSAVTSGIFRPEEHKAVAAAEIDRKLITPRAGDLLFSRANTRELVAATCLVEQDSPRLFLPDKLWRIMPNESEATAPYLRFLLSHDRLRYELTRTATGTSGSMLNISMGKLRALRVPIPPVDMQAKFSALVWDSLRAKARTEQAQRESELLFESLVARAFSGALAESC